METFLRQSELKEPGGREGGREGGSEEEDDEEQRSERSKRWEHIAWEVCVCDANKAVDDLRGEGGHFFERATSSAL